MHQRERERVNERERESMRERACETESLYKVNLSV